MTNKQSFYLDINIFRPITREFKRWKKFAEFFDRGESGLLDSPIFFTWAQLLESIDLGTIMTQIKKSPIWTKATKKKNLLDCLAPHKALNELFAAAIDTVAALPSLQKDALLKGIDKAVANTCQEAKSLVENTFLRYRLFIASDNYMKELSRELAWAFITSYSFVMSIHQWDKRKKYYDSLMALWHKLYLEGHDLVFFRMAEMQYFSYLQHASELDLNEALILYPQAKDRKGLVNEIFKFPPLKAESDLCDGEIIDFARIGSRVGESDIRAPVIGITTDEHLKLDQRAGIFLRSLLDLKRCVDGWSVKPCPGKLFSLNIEKDGTIRSAHRLLLGN